MKKNVFYTLIFALTVGLIAAFRPVSTKRQGVEGYLYKISGNQMPSPGVKPSPPKGVKGNLYIYELTNISQSVKKGETPFYASVSTRRIKKVQTDDKGYFNVQLPVGKYSIFIKKDAFLYANRFDSENNIAPVEVKKGKMTNLEVRMDDNAVY